jgi:hypothetical protein
VLPILAFLRQFCYYPKGHNLFHGQLDEEITMKKISMRNASRYAQNGIAVLLLAGSLTNHPLRAQAALPPGNLGNPGVAPPQSVFQGHTYSEWSAAWFQWVFSMPTTKNPLSNTADCSEGQKGKVWFIGNRNPGVPLPVSRACTIPAGTALFLNVSTSEWDNELCDPAGIQRTTLTEDQLRAHAKADVNSFLSDPRRIVIDGVDVQGLPPACDPSNPSTCQSPYRVQSPVFNYTVPAFDNLLIPFDGPCYNNPNGNGTPYTVTNAVADGLYVLIEPLPVGQHTIRFGRVNQNLPFLYNITVTP